MADSPLPISLAAVTGRFLVVEADGTCVAASPEAARTLGATPESLAGKRLQELNLGPELQSLATVLAAARGHRADVQRSATDTAPAPSSPASAPGPRVVVWLPACPLTSGAAAEEPGSAPAADAVIGRHHGLVTVCSCCGSVRGAAGKWLPLARVLQQHVGVRFSHGLCEKCAGSYLWRLDQDYPRGPGGKGC
ncbi:MAG: hypothetical protein HY903_00525 [Deltaproteobacteria bacterium]|nr:hypothetical protein [Deltaproteobacteria bacterium]